jgi:hypothetical protein
MHLPSQREFVLNAGDETHAYTPSDINDRGEVVGYLNEVPANDDGSRCGPSTPIFWQRSGAQVTLPKLPGAASARPWSTYANGVVVGESGAGGYCIGISTFDNRAVIWHGSSVFDLNTLIPAGENITLVNAAEINASGVIAASGYRNDDPLRPCPDYATNTETGVLEMDLTLTCRDLRVYLLTPVAASP